MKALELIDSFIEKSKKYIKEEDDINFSLSLTYKQGCFLNSLLVKEDLIYSNSKGCFKKSGFTKSFILRKTHLKLLTPDSWYGDKGIFTLIFDKRFIQNE